MTMIGAPVYLAMFLTSFARCTGDRKAGRSRSQRLANADADPPQEAQSWKHPRQEKTAMTGLDSQFRNGR